MGFTVYVNGIDWRIAIPSLYLMLRGIKDAGKEIMRPKQEHEIYGGIYERIRHPHAVGEFPLW
jgi:hypothetical protein